VISSARGTGRQSQSSTRLTGGSVWMSAKMVIAPASASSACRIIPQAGISSIRTISTSMPNSIVVSSRSG
jgi:hypothetical protein